MASYMLIESRDPFEVNDVAYFYDLASSLKSRGNDVTLFLVQNGVLPARQSSGADLTVLLRGNAVNYAVLGQVSPALAFGDWKQTHAAHLDEDIASLISKGVDVYAVEDDFAARGISLSGLIPGVKTVNRDGMLDLVENHDRVWHW